MAPARSESVRPGCDWEGQPRMESESCDPGSIDRCRVMVCDTEGADGARLRELLGESRTVSFAWAGGLPSSPPDVVILSIGDRFDAAAIERARALGGGDASLPVVVVADPDDETMARAALTAGASAYLTRRELGTRLLVTTLLSAIAARRMGSRIAELRAQGRQLATRDPLTSLANRDLFHDRLARALATSKRTGQRMGVLFLDLDNFKLVNDSLGHAAGDQLLRVVASIITGCLRESDTAARLGGDEFGVLLTSLAEEIDADRLARKVIHALSRPIPIHGRSVYCSVSIGIATVPGNGADADDLLRKADTAMYHAKARGRNRSEFFTEAMNDLVVRRAAVEAALRTATRDGCLEVHYQPIFDVRRARMVGAEALIRWKHDELGRLNPDDFLPLAEETGLILEIGEWVLQTACRQAVQWQGLGHEGFRMAVNVSPRQLQDPGFAQTVEKALLSSDLNPKNLELEITESTLVKDGGLMIESLHELKEIGVHLAVDDFGTGYSALAYLKDLPVDLLKIDRSFVDSLMVDPAGATIVQAIVQMAQGLNLTTVAEGVESQDQLLLLGSYGCHRMQGYLFGRPIPAEAFTHWIEDPRMDWQPREAECATEAAEEDPRAAEEAQDEATDEPTLRMFGSSD